MKINHPKHTPPPDPLENMSRGNKRKRAQVNQCGKVDGKKTHKAGWYPVWRHAEIYAAKA